jgi:hypothetical protein
MKFYDWIGARASFERVIRERNGKLPAERLDELWDWYVKNTKGVTSVDQQSLALEDLWCECRRPYYSIYPSIIKSLLAVKLTLPCSRFHWPLKTNEPILIRLPTNSMDESKPHVINVLATPVTLQECANDAEHLMFNASCDETESLIHLSIVYLFKCKGHMIRGAMNINLTENMNSTFEKILDEMLYRHNTTFYSGLSEQEGINITCEAVRLVVALTLVAENTEFVRPDVLSDDAAIYAKTLDPKYVDKAIRRGKRGWTIGKQLEEDRTRSPHIRLPHFGIRWKGTGRTRAELVPIKGSVVNRLNLNKVPTGYLDDEDSKSGFEITAEAPLATET